MASSIFLSIITPCYNPPPQWLDSYLEQVKLIESTLDTLTIEFVIVNDGSKEDLSPLFTPLPHPSIKWVSYNKNRGKGYAIREGVKYASGKYIIYTDMDFPFGTDCIYQIYDLLHQGYDLVIGKRSKEYFDKLPIKRQLISTILKTMNHLWLPSELNDTQAGIKGFRQELKYVFLRNKINSFVFEIEFLIRASHLKNLTYTTVPVSPIQNIVFSDFSMKVIWKEIKNLFLILYPEKSAPTQPEEKAIKKSSKASRIKRNIA
ncbi:glycosyltransferase [Runella sp. MFBS21]|uniref:glycosyltransferase n=1 Tax=Runella sp. MFBS21 TaxID=3034018 RepID=UPI0023F8E22E|nr:glycosyltransferase [Runella sp. MFBS21]MDF7821109.1 glycosyltransferase [Runella sp. MFBS21]